MPGYKVHAAGGLVSIALLSVLQSVLAPGAWSWGYLIPGLVGSLLPDLDTKSKFQKIALVWTIPVLALCYGGQRMGLGLVLVGVWIWLWIIPHRGILHRGYFHIGLLGMLWYALYASAVHPVVAQWIVIYAGGGIASHLFLDRYGSRMYKKRF